MSMILLYIDNESVLLESVLAEVKKNASLDRNTQIFRLRDFILRDMPYTKDRNIRIPLYGELLNARKFIWSFWEEVFNHYNQKVAEGC